MVKILVRRQLLGCHHVAFFALLGEQPRTIPLYLWLGNMSSVLRNSLACVEMLVEAHVEIAKHKLIMRVEHLRMRACPLQLLKVTFQFAA